MRVAIASSSKIDIATTSRGRPGTSNLSDQVRVSRWQCTAVVVCLRCQRAGRSDARRGSSYSGLHPHIAWGCLRGACEGDESMRVAPSRGSHSGAVGSLRCLDVGEDVTVGKDRYSPARPYRSGLKMPHSLFIMRGCAAAVPTPKVRLLYLDLRAQSALLVLRCPADRKCTTWWRIVLGADSAEVPLLLPHLDRLGGDSTPLSRRRCHRTPDGGTATGAGGCVTRTRMGARFPVLCNSRRAGRLRVCNKCPSQQNTARKIRQAVFHDRLLFVGTGWSSD